MAHKPPKDLKKRRKASAKVLLKRTIKDMIKDVKKIIGATPIPGKVIVRPPRFKKRKKKK